MAMKVSADEVLALSEASVAMEPAMHHLLMQVQVNSQGQVQSHGQIPGQTPVQTSTHAPNEMTPSVISVDKQVKVDSVAGPTIDLMPLSAAAVVIGSPPNAGGAMDQTLVGPGQTSASGATPGATPKYAVKRKSIPLSMKKEAIQWIMGPGKGIPSRAEKHFGALNWDVSASSFRKWWKNREKILGDSGSKKRISGGGRKPFLEDSEEKLLVVVIQERAKKDRVTRKWIAKTAQHMFQRSDASFKASENWVTKFIRRNGLTLKRSYVTYEPQTPVEQQQKAMPNANVPSTATTQATMPTIDVSAATNESVV